ncbi:cold shock domain-containing protein [Aurantimonas sp. VKM B-3413]|uniref:cold shock domain-containing protein n=1 Tax=Aurantimonas sp. VKM B-3413 TaxID=2779401 RepID=UPI001E36C3B3|nr:cold shock domain-containing protein [Aurantimonas sp. VKM B-3413]MCB8838084.1 cold shock domain-containing protein [Aurantimonas sp. VKM B-3413]
MTIDSQSSNTNISPSDSALARLTSIIYSYDDLITGLSSEEDTKIRLITKILTQVLGWDENDINCERKHDSGYSDYVIGQKSDAAFVLEAKNLGLLNIDTAHKDKLKHVALSNPALKACNEGISQVRSYALDEGYPFAVLTDGNVWIIFKPFIPNQSYRKVATFVFPSLESVRNDFHVFYELLSSREVIERTYAIRFDQIHNKAAHIDGAKYTALSDVEIKLTGKADFAFEIERILDHFFDKIRGDDDPDLILHCFVESRESRYAEFSLEKLTDRILGNIKSSDIEDNLTAVVKSAAAEANYGETVFIVGPNGSGKSTFIDRFFKMILPHDLRLRCAHLNVNLLDITGAQQTCTKEAIELLISSIHDNFYLNPEGEENGPDYAKMKGLFYREYDRRKRITKRTMYKTNRTKFDIEFEAFVEEHVEKNRDDYLRRLLFDLVKNRKMLPVIVMDNIDDHDDAVKILLFQLVQSLKRSIRHALLLFPITDKTAWRLASHDIVNVYGSRSFFLPTPSPREVFRKRIEYLVGEDKSKGKKRTSEFYLSRGIRLQIHDINKFAAVINDVFVNQEYTAQTLGELSNYNIRITLKLARRVITSPALDLERLVSAYVIGQADVVPFNQFLEALLKGEYSSFKSGDCPQLYNLFETDAGLIQSPLLKLRILRLLETQMLTGRKIEDRHLTVQSMVDFFDSLGSSEASTSSAIKRLSEFGLIEKFDTSTGELIGAQSFAITQRGIAHLNLATRFPIFVEQLALTTAMHDKADADEIGRIYRGSDSALAKRNKIVYRFISRLIERDASLLALTVDDDRGGQNSLLEALDLVSKNTPGLRRRIFGSGAQSARCVVERFDGNSTYGFLKALDHDWKVFIHRDRLKEAGYGEIFEGDIVVCNVIEEDRGYAVDKVLSVDPGETHIGEGTIVKVNGERGFAFIRMEGIVNDVYMSLSGMTPSEVSGVIEGARKKFEYYPNPTRPGHHNVRKILG